MDKELRRQQKTQRGYTLIEMVVVTAILALMATLIVPNLVAMQRSRVQRDTEAAILRLPSEAKNLAIQFKTPMVIQINNNTLVLAQDTDDQPATSSRTTNRLQPSPAPKTNSRTNDSSVNREVPLGNDIQVESAKKDGENVDASSWRWVVYPDGSSDTAGLVFMMGANRKSLYLPADEPPRWIEGDLPDPTQERWKAGDVEQRATQ